MCFLDKNMKKMPLFKKVFRDMFIVTLGNALKKAASF
jgi:hypothetical protein